MIRCNLTEYQLEFYEDANTLQIRLNHKIYWVGRIEGYLNPPHNIHLQNIEIFEKPVYANRNLLAQIVRIFPGISTPSYRGKGLASVLLIALIEFAYEKRVDHIWGSVKSQGGLDDESLLNWFERYGFRASSPTEKNSPDAIAHIQFDFS